MCLIVFAWKILPNTPLIAAANRDEFLDRPSMPANTWEDHPQIFAGRDLKAGGTWLGVTQSNRFAAITIIHDLQATNNDAPSRGNLVADFLYNDVSPSDYVSAIKDKVQQYNGFNLLVGDIDELIWFSNQNQDDARNGQKLSPGIYGLSNASLDTPWPKVLRTKAQFSSLLCQRAPQEAYFDMLADTTQASSDCRLPHTNHSIQREREMSSPFIQTCDYGTRTSSVVHLNTNAPASLIEKTHPAP